MKIYLVCDEYYDYPSWDILKAFADREKAIKFKEKIEKSKNWRESVEGTTRCLAIRTIDVVMD